MGGAELGWYGTLNSSDLWSFRWTETLWLS